MNMNRLKISTRLALSFAAMVLLLVALGGVALIRSSVQEDALDEIIHRRIPITQALNNIVDGTNEQAIQFRNLIVFSAESIQKSARSRIQEARSSVKDQTSTLAQLIRSEKGQSLLADLNQQRTSFLQQGDEFIVLMEQGRKEDAQEMLETQLRPTQLAYQEAILELLKHQDQSRDKAEKEAQDAAYELRRDVLIAAAIAVALAALMAVAIIRSITRPLAQAVAVADRVASGDLASDVAVQSRDEMGLLLGALQRMQQGLITTVATVRTNAQGVASASAQIAAGNHDLSGRTEEQASALEETAASMEELSIGTAQCQRSQGNQATHHHQCGTGGTRLPARGQGWKYHG